MRQESKTQRAGELSMFPFLYFTSCLSHLATHSNLRVTHFAVFVHSEWLVWSVNCKDWKMKAFIFSAPIQFHVESSKSYKLTWLEMWMDRFRANMKLFRCNVFISLNCWLNILFATFSYFCRSLAWERGKFYFLLQFGESGWWWWWRVAVVESGGGVVLLIHSRLAHLWISSFFCHNCNSDTMHCHE